MMKIKTLFLLFISMKCYTQIKTPFVLNENEEFSKNFQQKGNFSRLGAWVLNEEQNVCDGNQTGICIYFSKDFYVEKTNGNKYAKGHLENNTLNDVLIDRVDSTIDNIQSFFFIEGKWIAGQTNGKSSCGNSYFKKELKAKRKIEFQLSINDLVYGDIKTPFKIVVTINGQKVESNIIEVNLFESQIKNLTK